MIRIPSTGKIDLGINYLCAKVVCYGCDYWNFFASVDIVKNKGQYKVLNERYIE